MIVIVSVCVIVIMRRIVCTMLCTMHYNTMHCTMHTVHLAAPDVVQSCGNRVLKYERYVSLFVKSMPSEV